MSYGSSVPRETPQTRSDEEAPGSPWKGNACNGNQQAELIFQN
ncbi:hypothetical protein GCM10009865_35010 [Aeromicrobium ponti]